MGPTDTAQDGLAERFAALLQRHKDANKWSNTYMAVTVWGTDRRSHISAYLNAKKGNPTRATVFNITGKLGIPDSETETLFESAAQNWPAILAPGIVMRGRTVVGREDDVAALHAALEAEDRAALLPGAVVRGQGGMGKTTLARHYVQRYGRDYHGIWWLNAATPDGLIADFAALAGHIGAGEHPTDEARARAAVMALEKRTEPWLLIYDNAEDSGALTGWTPHGPRILITTRRAGWSGYAERPVGKLDKDAAADLLMAEAQRSDDRDGAEQLADTLGGLPLALVLAGAWLRDTTASFGEYEAQIEAMLDNKPKDVDVHDYPDSVFGAVSLSLDKLGKDAALLMRVLCYLSPDDLWPGLVTDLEGKADGGDFWKETLEPIPDALWTLAKNRPAVERAFAELRRHSLLELDTDNQNRSPGQRSGASKNDAETPDEDHPDPDARPGTRIDLETPHYLHRLTAAVQRSLDAATHRPAAAALLAAGYPSGSLPLYITSWPACARRAAAVAALAEAPPETAAMDYLLNQACASLEAQRRDDLALAYAEDSLRLKEARLGSTNMYVGITCNNLAGLYWRKGSLAKAESLIVRAISIADMAKNSEDMRAIWLNTHGLILQALANRLSEPKKQQKIYLSAQRFQEAIRLGRKNGFNKRLVTVWINNLGKLRAVNGRWIIALLLQGRALVLRRATLPLGDPDIADSLTSLSSTLLQAGRGRQGYRGTGCLDMLTEALAINEAAFLDAPDHPYRVGMAQLLAIAHRLLARPGPPVTGTLPPDPAEAEALEARYALDPAPILAHVEDYAERERLFAAGIEPPPP